MSMKRIVIFGTGSGGWRAWNVAADLGQLDVVAFADNDERKHGTMLHGRPIWSAAQLAASSEWDRVVIASQWHAEIAAGLVCLGIPRRRMIVLETPEGPLQLQQLAEAVVPGDRIQIGARSCARRTLPRVLILSFETLNETHGTGVLLKRYFSEFPRTHLLSLYRRETGVPWLQQSAQIRTSGRAGSAEVAVALRTFRFRPDIIYATALHEADIDLLNDVLAVVAPTLPIVQHFMDFIPNSADVFVRRFRGMAPRISEVWALTGALQRMLQDRLGRQVELVTGLLQDLAVDYRRSQPEYSPLFRTIMLGNFYNPAVATVVRDLWAECRARLPGLGPVEWYVAPKRVQDLLDSGIDMGLDFVWRGFVTGRRLEAVLRRADLGLVGFNCGTAATTDYQRYSLPSRLAEYAAFGVPVFALATPDTPLAELFRNTGLGRSCDAREISAAAGQLTDFIGDRNARSNCGAAGRRLAESDFDIGRFQRWFHGRLSMLVTKRTKA